MDCGNNLLKLVYKTYLEILGEESHMVLNVDISSI